MTLQLPRESYISVWPAQTVAKVGLIGPNIYQRWTNGRYQNDIVWLKFDSIFYWPNFNIKFTICYHLFHFIWLLGPNGSPTSQRSSISRRHSWESCRGLKDWRTFGQVNCRTIVIQNTQHVFLDLPFLPPGTWRKKTKWWLKSQNDRKHSTAGIAFQSFLRPGGWYRKSPWTTKLICSAASPAQNKMSCNRWSENNFWSLPTRKIGQNHPEPVCCLWCLSCNVWIKKNCPNNA